jgi:hypothetical protein
MPERSIGGVHMLRVIGLLTILGLLLVLIGAWFGWFSFSTDASGERKSVSFEVNEAEAKADANDARETIEGWADSVDRKLDDDDDPDPPADRMTVEGTLLDIDVANQRLEVDTDGGELVLQLDERCDVLIDAEKANATDLRAGDKLVVAVDRARNPDAAVRIVARRGA